jgi:hypothetical protein
VVIFISIYNNKSISICKWFCNRLLNIITITLKKQLALTFVKVRLHANERRNKNTLTNALLNNHGKPKVITNLNYNIIAKLTPNKN